MLYILKPTKEAFLKHDLYKFNLSGDFWSKAYTLENLPTIGHIKIAYAGSRFIYCETDRKDAGMGWFADDGSGVLREGGGGFGKMGGDWAEEHLTKPTPLENTKFRDCWTSHPEIRR
jgi:hypothetical protein